MNLLFEESGDVKAGVVLTQQGEAFQVETASGKRTKVRQRDVLLQFPSPEPERVMEEARMIAQEIDLAFLWEVAGSEEFGFVELGTEYFGHAPAPHEATGILLALQAAPIYFQRKGKGRFKAAPEATLKAALAGIEKKKQQAAVQADYAAQLQAGVLPESMRPIVLQLLFKPDKNSIEYKALEAACNALHTTPPRLMLAVGGIPSPKALHYGRFLFEHFPKGVEFPAVPVPSPPADLPVADVEAFSIDDVTTTEIDDAFSVMQLEGGLWRIGIHIAAPGLGIRRGDPVDAIARKRLSTVYMPGDKITMLPDALVEAYTLSAGKTCPALSLYATLDPAEWKVVATETRAERVPIASNLRHNDLDDLVTEDTLAAGSGDYPHKEQIATLWQWAQVLEKGRMEKRAQFGLKPEQANRVDFNFYVEDDVVSIVRRRRGAPLDKIVAELMIFANSTWGKLMHDHGVPGIYRSQGGGGGGWAARMQVRMVTHAAPHQGLGVDQYAWSTSPLRRYTDLVNQWQILACAEHGVTAPLVAPFKPKDADLFAIVSSFDAAYAGYADFQSGMERYWCLRWLAQHEARQVDAVVLKEDVLRLADIPLVLRLPGMPPLARGTAVRLELLRWDEVDLSVEARLLDVAAAPSTDAAQELESLEESGDVDAAETSHDAAATMPEPDGGISDAVDQGGQAGSADQGSAIVPLA